MASHAKIRKVFQSEVDAANSSLCESNGESYLLTDQSNIALPHKNSASNLSQTHGDDMSLTCINTTSDVLGGMYAFYL